MKEVTIIGGGMAGLLSAIQLVRAGIPVKLFEKNTYPFHRVCGEYISNETIPFLRSLNLYPEELKPAQINNFQLTSVNGKSVTIQLAMGGFGISRYSFDQWLYKRAITEGVEITTNTEITQLTFNGNQFEYLHNSQRFNTKVVVGAYGKRSRIDRQMGRSFMQKRSPYLGIKYHIKYNHPRNLIALHNFKNGYCGISHVENDIINLCYLSHRSNLKVAGQIRKMEQDVLCVNPYLKEIFNNAFFLFDQPEVINEISFEAKSPVENHVFMCGDAAGMITPLCGNGMAMAIHSSKLLCQSLIPFCKGAMSRLDAERSYEIAWKKQFAMRLQAGRLLQNLFGSTRASNFAVGLATMAKPVARGLISLTHGREF